MAKINSTEVRKVLFCTLCSEQYTWVLPKLTRRSVLTPYSTTQDHGSLHKSTFSISILYFVLGSKVKLLIFLHSVSIYNRTSAPSKPAHPLACAKVTHLRLPIEPHLHLRCHLLLLLDSRMIQNHQSEIFHLSSGTV